MEKKKINVALLYLNVNNLGDIVIYDTALYLLDKVLKEKNIDYNINNINIMNVDLDNMDLIELTSKEKKLLRYKKVFLNRIVKKFKNVKPDLAILKWKQTKYHKFVEETILSNLKDADLILFVGGGILNFKQQKFQYIIHDITEYADKKKIPVIINSAGIEGYDETNTNCLVLKRAINKKSVKSISTRDDIDTLNNNYLKKKNGMLSPDPALWVKETYNIKKTKSDIIGIGVIRPNIFKEYKINVDNDIILKMYSETITKLHDKGYKVKLFTNGGKRDQKFMDTLKEYMNAGEEFDKLVVPRCENAKDLVKVISKFKLVIGARLHSIIISYALDIPFVGIVWNIKHLLFAKITDTEKYFITTENFDSDYVVRMVEDSLNNQKPDCKLLKNKSYETMKYAINKAIKK